MNNVKIFTHEIIYLQGIFSTKIALLIPFCALAFILIINLLNNFAYNKKATCRAIRTYLWKL